MSKYTTEVRYICETLAGLDESKGYDEVENILNASWGRIFDFDFPIFDETYRSVLCKKILKHYYTREIGLESVGLWKLKLDTKMNEIMPLYNKRYESASFKFNPLWDVDYTRTTNGEENGTNSKETIGSRSNKETIDKSYEKILNEDTVDELVKNTTVNDTKNGFDKVEKTGTESRESNDNSNSIRGETNTKSKTGTEENNGSSIGTDRKTGTETLVKDRDVVENSVDKYSDTPQGGLVGVVNGTYLTKADVVDKSTTDDETDTTTFNTTDAVNSSTSDKTIYNTQDEELVNSNEVNIKEGKEDYEINRTDETVYNSSREEKTTGSDTRSVKKGGTDLGKEGGSVLNEDEHSENENGEFNTTKDYIEHIAGKMGGGSYARAIIEYRESLINVDMEIIEELGELFMRIW